MLITIAKTAMLFFVYGFLGWCVEVAFATIKNKSFVNRGFLNGTICPIYGAGLTGVVLLLRPMNGNIALELAGAFIVTTGIELVTGFLMEKLFHARWWDYSKMPMNIGGYVCLPFSVIWSFACLGVVEWINPPIEGLIDLLPDGLLLILTAFFTCVLIADLCCTLAAIRKLSERLRLLTEIGEQIHHLSDDLGENISDATLKVYDRVENTQDAAEEKLQRLRERMGSTQDNVEAKLRELREKLDSAMNIRSAAHDRILRAFPNMVSIRNQDALKQLREALEKRISR